MTKSRIFLWGMLSVITGVAVRSFIAVPYAVTGAAAAAGALAAAAGLARKEKKYAAYGFFLLAFAVGIVRFDLAEYRRPDLSRFYGRSSALLGVVAEEPSYTEKSQRLKIKITEMDGRAQTAPFFVLATVKKYPAYATGDELKVSGKIEQPENYNDFDYVSYLARDDIFAVMSFPKVEKTGEGKGNQFMLTLSRLKQKFEGNIDAALPEPHAAFMKGLLLGERASLPKDLTEDFKLAGVSHIVALSGYNITIVGKFTTRTLLFLAVPFAVSFWIAALAIILFVLLTGAAASVVRAGIMGILVLLAQKEGRSYHMTNALALAGAAMIFYQPYILRFDAGFQLSFLATTGLVYLSPMVERWLGRVLPPKKQSASLVLLLRQILVETLSAQLAVLPLLIYLFGRVSLVSPLTNILVLIAVPYAMAIGFAAGALGFLWSPLGVAAGWAAWIMLEYQLQIIRFFAHIPFASVEVGTWILAPLLVIYVMMFLKIWRISKDTQK